jgi:hypothetical protein
MVAMAMLCERKIKFSCLLVHLIGCDLAGDIEDDKKHLVAACLSSTTSGRLRKWSGDINGLLSWR